MADRPWGAIVPPTLTTTGLAETVAPSPVTKERNRPRTFLRADDLEYARWKDDADAARRTLSDQVREAMRQLPKVERAVDMLVLTAAARPLTDAESAVLRLLDPAAWEKATRPE
jgi:hypothetical protein